MAICRIMSLNGPARRTAVSSALRQAFNLGLFLGQQQFENGICPL